jgi:hypothetical protein
VEEDKKLMAEIDPNEKYTKSKGEEFEGEAHPGTPLEPDELPESPPQFQSATQAARSEQAPEERVHPTTELSSTPKHSPGKPSSGKHPTSELHVKPKGRR